MRPTRPATVKQTERPEKQPPSLVRYNPSGVNHNLRSPADAQNASLYYEPDSSVADHLDNSFPCTSRDQHRSITRAEASHNSLPPA